MTHPKVSSVFPARAAAPTFDLLQSVLAAIQRASKQLERDVEPNDRASRDFLKSLRLAAYSISFKFRELRAAGLGAELARYAAIILDAVEPRVSEGVLECAPCKVHACVGYILVESCSNYTHSWTYTVLALSRVYTITSTPSVTPWGVWPTTPPPTNPSLMSSASPIPPPAMTSISA